VDEKQRRAAAIEPDVVWDEHARKRPMQRSSGTLLPSRRSTSGSGCPRKSTTIAAERRHGSESMASRTVT